MKAIICKFLPPTNFRGSRIKAYDHDGNQIIVSYDRSLSRRENDKQACIALCKKMGWKGRLTSGWTKGGEVFVFIDDVFTV